jgi:hypothetical protein
MCNVTNLILELSLRQKAFVFDRLATPMWAVKELIENDFDDFLVNLETHKLFDQSDKEYVVDMKYYTRMSVKSQKMIEKLKEATERRINRLKNVLENETEPVLFVRYEEPNSYEDLGKRIELPEFNEKYSIKEIDYLTDLSKTLKSKYPNLKFKILYFTSQQNIDSENNIISICKLDSEMYHTRKIGAKLKKCLINQSKFISENL